MKNKTKEILLYQKFNGRKLDKALKALHLTRQQFANRIGVSRRSVQSWIAGSMPRGDRLVRVCEILKMDEKELVQKKFRVVIYK